MASELLTTTQKLHLILGIQILTAKTLILDDNFDSWKTVDDAVDLMSKTLEGWVKTHYKPSGSDNL